MLNEREENQMCIFDFSVAYCALLCVHTVSSFAVWCAIDVRSMPALVPLVMYFRFFVEQYKCNDAIKLILVVSSIIVCVCVCVHHVPTRRNEFRLIFSVHRR